MTLALVRGDQVSCSRLGGGMRRDCSRLLQHAQLLEDTLRHYGPGNGPESESAILVSLVALRAAADVLDEAGAALQRYATDLAQGHELGRRAELRVRDAGLLVEGTRVIEPWGPASAQESERRCALIPEVQARVDLATAHVGRARGRLMREMTRLAQGISDAPTSAQVVSLPGAEADTRRSPLNRQPRATLDHASRATP